MSQTHDDKNLLKVLQDHYHQLVNLIMELRIKSYRPATTSTANAILAKQLRNYINHFPATKLDFSLTEIHDNNQPKVATMKKSKFNSEHPISPQPTNHHPVFTETHLVNTVGEKLMQSTWDHLHASIRYARAGNSESARLHASIMDSALKEAAHFLDDEVYSEFVLNLGKELGSLAWSDESHAIEPPDTYKLH